MGTSRPKVKKFRFLHLKWPFARLICKIMKINFFCVKYIGNLVFNRQLNILKCTLEDLVPFPPRDTSAATLPQTGLSVCRHQQNYLYGHFGSIMRCYLDGHFGSIMQCCESSTGLYILLKNYMFSLVSLWHYSNKEVI